MSDIVDTLLNAYEHDDWDANLYKLAAEEIKRLRNPSPIVEFPPVPKSIDPTGW